MISFIVPVFNSAKTIENTLQTILCQKSNIIYEVIVVNDGSTDNIDDIMQKFNQEPRISYYKKENSGVASTRNFGVEKAKGEYIIFVDSDDYISKYLISDIEKYIIQGIDLIKWNPIFVDENKKEIKIPRSVFFENVTGEDGFNLLFGNDDLIDCLWNYAIKKELMVQFPAGTYHEDFRTMPFIILNAKTMVSIEKREYFYVQSKNSIMRSKDEEKTKKKLEDKLRHFDYIIEESEKLNIKKTTKENLKIWATNSMIAVISELEKVNKTYYKKELKKRKIYKHIKVRNIKQLIKKIVLMVR